MTVALREQNGDTVIRPAVESDVAVIVAIYNHYVAHTVITFEEEAVPATQMAERIRDVQSASLPWLVAEQSGRVLGYAYASKWKARSAYRFSVESTIYVDREAVGQGLGRALFAALKTRGAHAVIGGVALPNEPSVALHEKLGMKKVAHFEQVGFKFGRWIDVGYWQKVL
jgi:phosphinothricin acetyltransferase